MARHRIISVAALFLLASAEVTASCDCLISGSTPYGWSDECDVGAVLSSENDDLSVISAMYVAPSNLASSPLTALLSEVPAVPGIYTTSSSSLASVVSTPSDPLEAAGAAPVTHENLVYVVEKTEGGGIRHPDKALVLGALEGIAKHSRSSSLTVVVVGASSDELSSLKDDILFGVESVLSDSAFGAGDSEPPRLSSIFDLSATKVVGASELRAEDLGASPVADYVKSVRARVSSHRAFTRHIAAGVKLTSKPDTEEEDEEFDGEAMEVAISATAKLQAVAEATESTFTSKIDAISDSDAAIRDFGAQALDLAKEGCENFDQATEDARAAGVSQGDIVRMRRDVVEEMKRSAVKGLLGQVELLEKEEIALFKKNLSGLRVTPYLASEMDDVMKASIKGFASALSTLTSAGVVGSGSSATLAAGALRTFKAKVKAFNEERLLAAQASGSFTPVPRKPVSIGMHYLIPSLGDGGGDFRSAAQQDPNNVIYTPANKRNEVDKKDVLNGRDWRSKVSPPKVDSGVVFSK